MHFSDVQRQFMEEIKNPSQPSQFADIEQRRMAIYQDLFFNNVKGFIDSGFPVLQSLYSEDRWRQLVRGFFIEHACRSPYFADISKEFVEYLANTYVMQPDDPPFLQELAHYEWVELSISIRHGSAVISNANELHIDSLLCLSDVSVLLSYQFPVHGISPDYQPQEPEEPVYLIVYRDAEDDVAFMLINQLTALAVKQIEDAEGTLTLRALMADMTERFQQFDTSVLQNGLTDTLRMLIDKHILYLK
ncbi:putative DNA-binding domain-containing protein [Aestuariibacter sp. AA17]|uniref:DNA-binding domain-containing protein n=1 Tax=Fluctibacter corallii TaxID=2984329 RepID=A0ABT3A8Q1_9ALTE|nr:putative DNA-binding domain-containing protein [Aestuariibacter sp. AA17]MCV2885056.1 putative DNA-binding domain-containing protein [Aestuariibacter sp. AA17]